MDKIKYISRELYNSCKGDAEALSALAFAWKFKNLKPTSVLKDYSLRKLSTLMGCSVNTTRKRVSSLLSMDLAYIQQKNGHTYFVVRKLRSPKMTSATGKVFTPQRKDIDCSKIQDSQLKEIKLGLQTLHIKEIINHKNYLKQLIDIATGRDKHSSLNDIKRARRLVRRRGYDVTDSSKLVFVDNGISYRKLSKDLGVSRRTVKKMGEYGERNSVFQKITPSPIKVHKSVSIDICIEFSDIDYTYTSGYTLFKQPCCKYVAMYN